MSADALNYTTFNSAMGWLGILGSARGLLSTTLPQRTVREVLRQLGDGVALGSRSPHLFTDLMQRLRAYFAGEQADFPDELALSRATTFQRKVWEITRLIPYGETRTYGWVAERIGKPKAARAVGQALSRNPLPVIVPCHRVIASDGKLGGFTGGLDMKQALLALESRAKIE
ncbi:methylated-DNA--[protein]-cysteine S-methyltransferase [Chloroflexota bacterium]